jgi:hypothetical protein
MRPVAAVWLCAAGCASASAIEDQPLFVAGWSGPPPHVAVQVEGPAAGPSLQRRCLDRLARSGAVVDASASVQARLTLDPSGNRLQVLSLRRGVVRDVPRPAWSVERLCNDALLAMVSAIREESPRRGGAPPPESPYEPASPTTEGPAANGPATPAPAPTSSGGGYHGPIN